MQSRRREYYETLFKIADLENNNIISGEEGKLFFQKSGLDATILAQMWAAVANNQPALSKEQFFRCLDMISLIQNGQHPTQGVVNEHTPFPVFQGVTIPVQGDSGGQAFQWVITESLRQSYQGYFTKLDLDNDGYITGTEAYEFFSRSNLPKDVLGQIWVLADRNQDGKLDLAEFSIALFLVHAIQADHSIPNPLPESLINSAYRNTTQNITNSSPPPTSTGNTVTNTESSVPLKDIDPSEIDWTINNEEKAKFERIFSALDTNQDNTISGQEARELFISSNLSNSELAKIYELADVTRDTKLDRKEFFIAMKLIALRSQGIPIPDTLPDEVYASVGITKSQNLFEQQSIFSNNPTPKKKIEKDEIDHEKVQEINQEIDDLNIKIESLIAVNLQLADELEISRMQKKEIESSVNNAKSQRVKLQSEIRRLDSKIKNLKDKNFELSGKIIRREAQLGAKTKNKEATRLKDELNDILSQIEAKELELQDLQQQLDDQQIQQKLEAQKRKQQSKKEEEEALDFARPFVDSSSSSDEIVNPFTSPDEIVNPPPSLNPPSQETPTSISGEAPSNPFLDFDF